MDNSNQPSQTPTPLAGDISQPEVDPFANNSEEVESTKKFVEFMNNQQGAKPVVPQPQKTEVKKSGNFFSRLMNNLLKPPTTKTIGQQHKLIQAEAPSKNNSGIKNTANSIFKKMLIVFLVILLIVGAYLFTFFTNIDSQILKISLSGVVANSQDNKPISNAEIFIDGSSVAKTGSDGKYLITLSKMSFEFKVTADNFTDFSEQVTLPKTILNYSFTKNVTLTSAITSQLEGKFLANKPDYTFENDKLFINDKQYVLNKDGTFSLDAVPTGKVTLKFESSSFLDIDQELELKTGSNKIQEIQLTPAGDIVGTLLSYITETPVPNTQFNVENVLASQINISNDGKFRIRDLDLGKSYKIRITSKGYKTRDYDITIKQGDNEFFNLEMVEDGRATYITRDENNQEHFYTSDFDGMNAKELETIQNFSPKYEYYNSVDGLLYFLSNHGKVKNSFKTIDAAYSLNPETKEIKLITQTATTLDTITPNFRAKKLINIYTVRNDIQRTKKLQVTDLDGNNLKELRSTTGNNNFDNLKVSDNGNFVFFREGDLSKAPATVPTLYRIDVNSKSLVTIAQKRDMVVYDSSDDGNLLLYSALNEKTGFEDLFLFNATSSETRTLQENLDGNQYQFLNLDNDQVIFFATREKRMDIYDYTISQNSTRRITNLAVDDVIQHLYQQEHYAFYITKRGLYVIDITNPKSFKLVTNKITKYTN